MEHVNVKNVCISLGVMFGLLVIFSINFCIPCALLLIIGAIQTFEITKKEKRELENSLKEKLSIFENKMLDFKKDTDRVKADFDSIKSKLNLFQMYGNRQQ